MLLSCGDALVDFLPVKSVDGRDSTVPLVGTAVRGKVGRSRFEPCGSMICWRARGCPLRNLWPPPSYGGGGPVGAGGGRAEVAGHVLFAGQAVAKGPIIRLIPWF